MNNLLDFDSFSIISITECLEITDDIQDWINWYINKGADSIYIIGNKEISANSLKVKILPRIADISFIEQLNNIYKSIKSNWVIFCTIDDFLRTPTTNDNIREWLSWDCFKLFSEIFVNRRIYDDNDLVKHSTLGIVNTYTRPCMKSLWCLNEEGHTDEYLLIIKGGLNLNHVHPTLEKSEQRYKFSNVLGLMVVNCKYYKCDYDDRYKVAYFAYYPYKSIEDYVLRYVNKPLSEITEKDINFFWMFNERTVDKLASIIPNYDRSTYVKWGPLDILVSMKYD